VALHLESIGRERGKGTDRSGELSDQDTRYAPLKPIDVPTIFLEPDRNFVTECGWQRVLAMCPARHHCVAMAFG
jgi:hypothetical protein